MGFNKKTVSFPDSMVKRLAELSKRWNVSEGEVMRRFFVIADNIVKEADEGKEIYSEKKGGAERAKLVMPF